MCGRYMSATPVDLLSSHFQADTGETAGLERRFNVAPTCVVPVVLVRDGRRVIDAMRWGLVPSWAPDPSVGSRMINARLESLGERPAFRTPLARRRCIVPADGYYEWRPGGQVRQPYLVRSAEHPDLPLAFAGLWEAWYGGPAGPLLTCTIVTTAAAGPVAWLHDRMPVVLPADGWARWLDVGGLDAAGALELLAGVPVPALAATAVSTRVNDVRNDGPDVCVPVVPVAEEPAAEQLGLPF